jgi:Putative peptidoglycan binding domain
MTIAMPDDTDVSKLPPGYDAYLGYADGRYANAAALKAKFPTAELVILTVTGETFAPPCNGADIEPGNLTAADGARWAAGFLNGKAGRQPVLYASVEGEAGYGMSDVVAELAIRDIGLAEVRLLTAHYGQGPHICGPHSCGLLNLEADGTQWTDESSGGDMSMLAGDFFTRLLTGTEQIVQELGIVAQGATGEAVRTVQALVNAREKGNGAPLAIDGVFGVNTFAAVRFIQINAKITADGIVGPATWPVLLGIA